MEFEVKNPNTGKKETWSKQRLDAYAQIYEIDVKISTPQKKKTKKASQDLDEPESETKNE